MVKGVTEGSKKDQHHIKHAQTHTHALNQPHMNTHTIVYRTKRVQTVILLRL